jgi:hypothetical protein
MISTLDHLLADEALGALDPARSLLIAALAEMRPEVARDIARYEAAGGSLLAGVAPVPLGAGSFERLSALIAAQPTSPEADDAAFPGGAGTTSCPASRPSIWRPPCRGPGAAQRPAPSCSGSIPAGAFPAMPMAGRS